MHRDLRDRRRWRDGQRATARDLGDDHARGPADREALHPSAPRHAYVAALRADVLDCGVRDEAVPGEAHSIRAEGERGRGTTEHEPAHAEEREREDRDGDDVPRPVLVRIRARAERDDPERARGDEGDERVDDAPCPDELDPSAARELLGEPALEPARDEAERAVLVDPEDAEDQRGDGQPAEMKRRAREPGGGAEPEEQPGAPVEEGLVAETEPQSCTQRNPIA